MTTISLYNQRKFNFAHRSPMPINTQWFKTKLDERQLSQRGLAKLMGLDSSAVSLMLRGRREMKLNEAAQIAALIGVPAEEVLANVGVNLKSQGASVPIVATMDGVGEVSFGDSATLGTVPRPAGDYPTHLQAIQCRTAGTELDYMDRWILLIGDMREGVDPESIERLSLYRRRGGLMSVGMIRRGYTRGKWDISSPRRMIRDAELEFAMPVLLILP